MSTYLFADHDEFVDRKDELERIQRWWDDARDPFPLMLYGRRRTGKSWLLREFAHRKDADFFVCDSRAEGDQLAYFASVLGRSIGVVPALPDVRTFFDVLLRQPNARRRLVVIDEFPLLLEQSRGADSSLAAVMEERESAAVKLVLCGSQVSTMESLLGARAPLHGRATPLSLAPLTFETAREFLPGLRPEELITRFAIVGGMPLYLRRMARRASLKSVICEEALSSLAPLHDEVREVLSMELPSTATYFSLLAALSRSSSLEWADLVQRSHVEESIASRYVRTLEDLRIVESANPAFAPPNARRRRYRVADQFVRFWFRFIFPFQADLSSGFRPGDHYDRNVEPFLADHVAATFEDICRAWVRSHFEVSTVRAWWGLARHDLRRRKTRTTEEIDVVGAHGRKVVVVGECRWRSQRMGRDVLDDVVEYKLPALAQTGADISGVRVALFSRSGFRAELREMAARRGDVVLVELADLAAWTAPA